MNNIPKGYKQTEAGVIPEEWELRSGLKITERISKGASPNALGQPKSLAWFDLVWYLCNGPLHKYLVGASSPCLIKFKLEPGHLSQLGFYLSVVDEILRHPDDQPTIGLLLVREKDHLVAEYCLRGQSQPLGIAEWQTTLTTQLPEDMQSSLPSIEQIERELAVALGEGGETNE